MSEPEITQDEQDVEGHSRGRETPNASAGDDAARPDDGEDVAGHGTVRSKA